MAQVEAFAYSSAFVSIFVTMLAAYRAVRYSGSQMDWRVMALMSMNPYGTLSLYLWSLFDDNIASRHIWIAKSVYITTPFVMFLYLAWGHPV